MVNDHYVCIHEYAGNFDCSEHECIYSVAQLKEQEILHILYAKKENYMIMEIIITIHSENALAITNHYASRVALEGKTQFAYYQQYGE